MSRIITGLVKSYQPKPKASRFVWLAVGEEAKQRPGLQVNVYCRDISFFVSMYNKTIITFGFCDIQNNQGLGKGYQLQPLPSADNSYLDLKLQVGYLRLDMCGVFEKNHFTSRI